MNARHIIDTCHRHFVTLSRVGDGIELEPLFPEDFPMPVELVDDVRRHKNEILVWLDYEVQADALLLESTRRIAVMWVPGCDLDTPEWEAHETALHDAYWSENLDRLKAVFHKREAYALSVFEHHRNKAHHV